MGQLRPPVLRHYRTPLHVVAARARAAHEHVAPCARFTDAARAPPRADVRSAEGRQSSPTRLPSARAYWILKGDWRSLGNRAGHDCFHDTTASGRTTVSGLTSLRDVESGWLRRSRVPGGKEAFFSLTHRNVSTRTRRDVGLRLGGGAAPRRSAVFAVWGDRDEFRAGAMRSMGMDCRVFRMHAVGRHRLFVGRQRTADSRRRAPG